MLSATSTGRSTISSLAAFTGIVGSNRPGVSAARPLVRSIGWFAR
jgi:hypothetical protein